MTRTCAQTRTLFGVDKALIGMVHVGALSGTPRHTDPIERIIEQAVSEAQLLAESGFDAVILENMHDAPYLRRRVGPEIVACMTAIVRAVRSEIHKPLGLQILAGANCEALAAAQASGADFIRAEGFVFASVADEGLFAEADAGSLLRYRKMIGAEHVRILADIKKKHSAHAMTADVDLAETARAAEFFGADGVIVTGTATGAATAPEHVQAAAGATKLPVIVGSGVTPEQVPKLFEHADALIIGSYIKREGHWANEPDPARIQHIVEAAHETRRSPA